MNRGDVTHKPVVIGNRFYLFKLSAVERDPKAKPFELVRNQLAQAVKRQKSRESDRTYLERQRH